MKHLFKSSVFFANRYSFERKVRCTHHCKQLVDTHIHVTFVIEAIIKMPSLLNPLSASPTKWPNTQTIRRQIADELFEYV